jgi:RNA ligase (TIGR02306 family)
MRKLASIQRVLNIIPIPNADAIELVQINGWQCVVKKGAFLEGMLGVYFEIDAVPPDLPLFDFLWKGQPKRPESLHIRTMRLRGALSQGLLIPLADLADEGFPVRGLPDGTDVTDLLGVTKYEPPPPDGMGDYRGPFPSLVTKTDETRVQSFPQLIDELRGKPYVITLKCDGTSGTFCMWEDTFHACNRNHSILENDNIFWRVANRYRLDEVMSLYPYLALQGEVVGPGIQKNHMGLKTVDFRAFNLFNMKTGTHEDPIELFDFCEEHGIPVAPIVEEGESFDHTMESLLKLAEGKYDGTKNEREGIVIRPRIGIYSLTLASRLSFKAINNRFLLKGGD